MLYTSTWYEGATLYINRMKHLKSQLFQASGRNISCPLKANAKSC